MDQHMIHEQRITRCMDNVQEAVDKVRALIKESPDTPIGAVSIRSWMLAADINLQTMKQTLHDIQPTLF